MRTNRQRRDAGTRSRLSRLLLLHTISATAAIGCRALPAGVVAHPAELHDGRLVVCHLAYGPEYGHVIRGYVVGRDYVILANWPDDGGDPRLLLYDRTCGRVEETRSFDCFLECIDRLPEGVTVGWADTCCVPMSYGMSAEDRRRVRNVLERGRRRLITTADAGGADLLICTCESVVTQLPGDTGR